MASRYCCFFRKYHKYRSTADKILDDHTNINFGREYDAFVKFYGKILKQCFSKSTFGSYKDYQNSDNKSDLRNGIGNIIKSYHGTYGYDETSNLEVYIQTFVDEFLKKENGHKESFFENKDYVPWSPLSKFT